jgi:DNA replication and repair protein RecF
VGQKGRRTRKNRPRRTRGGSASPEEHFIDALRALYGPEKAAIRYGHRSTLEEYSEALREAHSADLERGTTSIGPHRDDFEVSLGGVNLTTFGSQGQQRIATLALKFASRDYVRGAVGEDPILLFDDVMSELDERRREYLAGYFLESTQAVISTTNLEYFDEEILRRTRIIRISGGSILETATDGARR